jgi:hypothetical protein
MDGEKMRANALESAQMARTRVHLHLIEAENRLEIRRANPYADKASLDLYEHGVEVAKERLEVAEYIIRALEACNGA